MEIVACENCKHYICRTIFDKAIKPFCALGHLLEPCPDFECLFEKLEEKQKMYTSLAEDNEALNKRVGELEAECNFLKDQIASQACEWYNRLAEWEGKLFASHEANDSLRVKRDSLREDLDMKTAEIRGRMERISQLNAENSLLTDALANYEQENARLKSENESLAQERACFRAVLEGAEYRDISSIAEKGIAFSLALGQTAKHISLKISLERDLLRIERDRLKDDNAHVRSLFELMECEARKLEAENEALHNRHEHANRILTELESERDRYREALEEIEDFYNETGGDSFAFRTSRAALAREE